MKKKYDKQKIQDKMLEELKQKHFNEKKQEIEILKKRLEQLQKEIECIRFYEKPRRNNTKLPLNYGS